MAILHSSAARRGDAHNFESRRTFPRPFRTRVAGAAQ